MSGKSVRERFMVQFTGMERYSRVGAWAVVGGYVAQVVAGIFVGNYLLSLPLTWGTGILIAVTAIFIGTRFRGLNNIVHECCHSSFSEHREDNVVLGRLCSVMLTGCFRRYKADHLSHHAHLGDYEHDNEMAAIEKFRLHDPLTVGTVLRHIMTPLLGRHLRAYSGINLSGEDGRFFLVLKIAILLGITAYTILEPLAALIFLLLPLYYIFPALNFWTDCLDHAGLVGVKDELAASRNVLAPAPIRWIFFPRNDCYHLIHHLFPQVPARHFIKVHETLCEDQEYRGQALATQPTHKGLIKSAFGLLGAKGAPASAKQES